MQRAVPYFFLALTLNIVLFHPMNGAGWDHTHSSADPINSLAEFLLEVWFDVPDHHAGDEREAESDHINGIAALSLMEVSSIRLTRQDIFILISGISVHASSAHLKPSFTIVNPPPEQFA